MNEIGYELIFCEADTGVMLNPDGSRHLGEQPEFHPTFATLEEAEQKRDGLLSRFVSAEVWIKDLATGEVGERQLSPLHPEYEEDRIAHNQWCSLPLLIRPFRKEPRRRHLHNK